MMIAKFCCSRCKRVKCEAEAVECNVHGCTMFERFQTVAEPKPTWALDYDRADTRGDKRNIASSITNTENRY